MKRGLTSAVSCECEVNGPYVYIMHIWDVQPWTFPYIKMYTLCIACHDRCVPYIWSDVDLDTYGSGI